MGVDTRRGQWKSVLSIEVGVSKGRGQYLTGLYFVISFVIMKEFDKILSLPFFDDL